MRPSQPERRTRHALGCVGRGAKAPYWLALMRSGVACPCGPRCVVGHAVTGAKDELLGLGRIEIVDVRWVVTAARAHGERWRRIDEPFGCRRVDVSDARTVALLTLHVAQML